MTTALIVLALIAIAMSVATVVNILRDGRGPSTPPRSHYEDRQFRSPGALA